MKNQATDIPHGSPHLMFVAGAERPYGSIELLNEAAAAAKSLPFRYSRFRVAPGRQSSLDQHDVLEVWIVVSGSGKLSYDDGTFPISAGQAVQFASGHPHQVLNDGTSDLVVFSFWWTA
jgi:mannose-6-phosphate isomerase-like protein (cupin superfamily)